MLWCITTPSQCDKVDLKFTNTVFCTMLEKSQKCQWLCNQFNYSQGSGKVRDLKTGLSQEQELYTGKDIFCIEQELYTEKDIYYV